MDLNGWPMADRAGAAKRRRERRLRSWLRHERMTVAAELSAALHHSRDGGQVKYDGLRAQKTDSAADGEEVVHDAHDALRGQKTPPPGVRPGSLCDPGPQRSDRTVRRSSGDSLPTLALPVLAGSAGEVVDSSLRSLTASALKARREEKEKVKEKEKEKERLAVHAEALVALERARLWSEQASRKRKRKKRRKRRTPRTSSRPSLSAVLVVDHGGGMLQAGFLQHFSSRCVLRCRWQARDAWHQGCFGPEEQLCAFS